MLYLNRRPLDAPESSSGGVARESSSVEEEMLYLNDEGDHVEESEWISEGEESHSPIESNEEKLFDSLAIMEDCQSSDDEEDEEEVIVGERVVGSGKEVEADDEEREEENDGEGHWFAYDIKDLKEGSTAMEECMDEIRKTWAPNDKRPAGTSGYSLKITKDIRDSDQPCLTALKYTGIMCPKFIDRVVACSNYYIRRGGRVGELRRNKYGEAFNRNNYLRFIYALFFMSIVRLPALKMYWERDIFRQDSVANIISYNLFRLMISAFHVENVDSGAGCASENKRRTMKDPAWRVRWLYDHYNKLWAACVIVHCFLALDEAIIPTKIRHALLQYIKGKPHKFGFKLYLLADPVLKFCIRAVLHDGKFCKKHEIVDRVVIAKFRIPGLCLVMDNYYWTMSSMCLVHSWGLHLLGTVIKNRIPKKAGQEWIVKHSNKERGRMAAQEFVNGSGVCTGIKAVSCSDKRVVTMVTTLPVSRVIVERRESKRVKQGQPKVTRTFQQPLPSIISVYNKTMGAADLVGYFMTLLRFNFRQRKWTLKVLFGPMSIAISNAHKLYNAALGKKLSVLEFVRLTLSELRGEIFSTIPEEPSTVERRTSMLNISPFFTDKSVTVSPIRKYERVYVSEAIRTDSNLHFPFRRDSASHRCYICKSRRMNTWCVRCNVPLCIDYVGSADAPEISDTCWYVHHMQVFTATKPAKKQ
tara:strand:- start:73 stop:2166 length:2094 start_codon:yes stop_codon:yes gene_type:complete